MEPLTCPSPPNDSQDLNLLAAPGHPSPMSPWHTGLAPTPDLWPGCRGGERRSLGFPVLSPEAEEAQWDGELSQGAALISLKLPSQFH